MTKIPKTNPESVNKLIHLPDLYTGPDGTGEIVAKVNDIIIDRETGWHWVTDVIDHIAFYEPWRPPTLDVGEDDLTTLGIINADEGSKNLLYIDTSSFPYRVGIDSSKIFGGSELKYGKLFKGRNIGPDAEVISTHYENNRLVSENIPLEKVIVSDSTNYSLKTLKESFVNKKLDAEDEVTLVLYSETGLPRAIVRLRVVHHALIRSLDVRESYVDSVELVSSFFNETDKSLLEIPMNVDVRGLDLTAIVRYSNGQTKELAIDGTKVALEGIDNYVPNSAGKTANVNLVYMLGENEYTKNAKGDRQYFINKKYKVITKASEGNYTVKLFVVPSWNKITESYDLDYYLYDLDRNGYYSATKYVEVTGDSAAFDPKKFGVKQWLTVSVDVSKVNRQSKQFVHYHKFAITLLRNGRSDETLWLLQYEDKPDAEYGFNLFADVTYQSPGNYLIDIKNNFSSNSSFLSAVYYKTFPLINNEISNVAPVPTHFILDIDGYKTEYPVSMWNNIIPSTVGIDEGKAIKLFWIRKLGGETIHLGCSPMAVRTHTQSTILKASNEVIIPEERLINEFLELRESQTTVNDFENTSISFSEDGTYELLWTANRDIEGNIVPNTADKHDWIEGDRNLSNKYQIALTVIDRWSTKNANSELTIDVELNGGSYTLGEYVDITGEVIFNFDQPYAITNSFIEVAITIKNKETNVTMAVTDTMKLVLK